MALTHHAQTRLQQRGIPAEAVDALLAYGNSRRHHGADVYYLDRQARSRARAGLGTPIFKRIEKALDSYLVVGDDGTIITAAHRLQRLKF
jgi:NAD kinase